MENEHAISAERHPKPEFLATLVSLKTHVAEAHKLFDELEHNHLAYIALATPTEATAAEPVPGPPKSPMLSEVGQIDDDVIRLKSKLLSVLSRIQI